LKQGDISGLEWLVLRRQLNAFRATCLIIQDKASGEEIVQEAFIKAFMHIASFDDRQPFALWFMRIVVTASLKIMQRAANRTMPFSTSHRSCPKNKAKKKIPMLGL